MKLLLSVLGIMILGSSIAQTPGEADYSPVQLAILNKDNTALLELIQKGADLRDRHGQDHDPMEMAILGHNPEAMRLLIAGGYDVERFGIDDPGLTSVQFAIIHRENMMLKVLLEQGAAYDNSNFTQEAPWEAALRIKNYEAYKLLQRAHYALPEFVIPARKKCLASQLNYLEVMYHDMIRKRFSDPTYRCVRAEVYRLMMKDEPELAPNDLVGK